MREAEPATAHGDTADGEIAISSPPSRSSVLPRADRPRSEPLDRETELRLARRWRRRGDRDAANRLVEANLRFVAKLAHRYRAHGVDAADLISEGTIGLFEALRYFDPERRLRFLTYASSWVRKCMLEYLLRNSGAVSLRRGQAEARMFFALRRERAALESRLAGDPSRVHRELAQRFATTETRVRQFAHRLSHHDVSLEAPRRWPGDGSPLDRLSDVGESPEALVSRAIQADLVRRACRRLDPRERAVVEARLLVDRSERESLARVGSRLGLSRERVRQIQLRAGRKLEVALARLAAPGRVSAPASSREPGTTGPPAHGSRGARPRSRA